MCLTYQRLRQLRRWLLVSPGAAELVAAIWPLARTQPPRSIRGPVGIVLKEVENLGWRWDVSPWHWRRPGDARAPAAGARDRRSIEDTSVDSARARRWQRRHGDARASAGGALRECGSERPERDPEEGAAGGR